MEHELAHSAQNVTQIEEVVPRGLDLPAQQLVQRTKVTALGRRWEPILARVLELLKVGMVGIVGVLHFSANADPPLREFREVHPACTAGKATHAKSWQRVECVDQRRGARVAARYGCNQDSGGIGACAGISLAIDQGVHHALRACTYGSAASATMVPTFYNYFDFGQGWPDTSRPSEPAAHHRER
eukprot:scaffold100737_cov75-Phaeocystis_antarctica.AAC.2